MLLDEPTAQLDVRGEAEVFDRLRRRPGGHHHLDLPSLLNGPACRPDLCARTRRVIELGSHRELMAQDGRYRRMFDLQAKRFEATMDEEGAVFDVL